MIINMLSTAYDAVHVISIAFWQIFNYFRFASDKVPGLKKIWLIGDEFIATTYRTYFRKVQTMMWMKENFEVKAYCTSRHSSSNTNLLSRMINTVIAAINDQVTLPDFILFIPDADICDALNYSGYGISTILGTWLEWLFKEISAAIKQCNKQLPVKSVNKTQIYWVAAPVHVNWIDEEYQTRIKFNNCLETVASVYGNRIRIIKLKEHWNANNTNLVANNKYTAAGLANYWMSIDAALKFNYEKKLDFETRDAYRQLVKLKNNRSTREEVSAGDAHVNEDMQQFFRRHREPLSLERRHFWRTTGG